MSYPLVAALWNLTDATGIHELLDDETTVVLSECGQYMGAWPTRFSTQLGLEDVTVGDQMPKVATTGIHNKDDEDRWNKLRFFLKRGYLREPDFGTSCWNRSSTPISSVCTCDMISVMNHGCPSNNGLPCPNRKFIR